MRVLSDPSTRHGWRRLTAEPARPARIRQLPAAHWLVVATVCVGAFMGQLDASIVTLAFPTLRAAFHASVGEVEWVALAYFVVLVGTVTAVGRFADAAGRKLLYIYGFAVFSVASLACGLAPDLRWLIAFRAAQALGAAMLQANSVALVATAMPVGAVGRGVGVQGAAQALGLALGPTVGGVLIGTLGWRWIFFVNVPTGVVGIVAGWFLLPRSRERSPRTPFDSAGFALLFAAAATVLISLSDVEDAALTAAAVWAPGALGAVLVVALFAHSRRARWPLLDPELFRRPAFGTGIAAGLLGYLVMFGVLFVVPFFLEDGRHQTAAHAGLTLTALPLALGVTAPFAGRAADRYGTRPVTVSGLVVVAASLLVAAVTVPGNGALVVLLAAAGVGFGAFTPANNAGVMAAAPRRQSGQAAGVLNMTRGFGTALGVAITALVYAGGGHGHGIGADAAQAGFRLAAYVLAGIALLAAGMALLPHHGRRSLLNSKKNGAGRRPCGMT